MVEKREDVFVEALDEAFSKIFESSEQFVENINEIDTVNIGELRQDLKQWCVKTITIMAVLLGKG